jgi:ribosomal protein S17
MKEKTQRFYVFEISHIFHIPYSIMSAGQPALKGQGQKAQGKLNSGHRSKQVYAAIYTRVSTMDQSSAKHLSLLVQEEECRKLAKEKGYTVVDVMSDVGSAFVRGVKYQSAAQKRTLSNSLTRFVSRVTRKVPEGSFAQMSKSPVTKLLVYSFDRFARDVVAGLQLLDKLQAVGISVESCSEPGADYKLPTGQHHITIAL